jgi:dipeptidyl aminopeptidase/acylaminoacyl peptidase
VPRFLPQDQGSRGLLFAMGSSRADSEIVVQNLDTGDRQVLAKGIGADYSATGHVLYLSIDDDLSTLFALPFSLERLEATGEGFPVAENVNSFGAAVDGTLVYTDAGLPFQQQLVWRDRSGAKLGEIGQPQRVIQMPALSPDGGRVVVRAIENDDPDNFDVWVHEIARGSKTRLSFGSAEEDRPIWLPGGDKISFSSYGSEINMSNIFLKSADGSGELEEMLATANADYGIDWSPDGKYLLFVRISPEAIASPQDNADIWYLRSKENEYESVPLVVSSFDEHAPVISADRRFVAYASNESGRYEIYVQRFPEADRRWQVSVKGGVQPRWRRDGRELFFVEDGALVAVSVTTKPTFSMGPAERLFKDEEAFDGRGHQYDVSADGERFVLVELVTESSVVSVHVVQNWFAEFKETQ